MFFPGIANPDKLKTRKGSQVGKLQEWDACMFQLVQSTYCNGRDRLVLVVVLVLYYHELAVEQDWTSMWWPCACCLSLFQQQQPANPYLLFVVL